MSDLEEGAKLDPPMSHFQGKPVDEKNRAPLRNMLNYIKQTPLGEKALFDVINAKMAKTEGKIHFSKPILDSISLLKIKKRPVGWVSYSRAR